MSSVSIRAPREGSDWSCDKPSTILAMFQSAPPVRGATISDREPVIGQGVSIRAPREGSDPRAAPQRLTGGWVFQSAPPVRGATQGVRVDRQHHGVSIRAPREGSDRRPPHRRQPSQPFQSAPPVRGATSSGSAWVGGQSFQSAPPVRGATRRGCTRLQTRRVSIRAPREGSDTRPQATPPPPGSFNPRPP